ncbi:hypothetical protein WIS52_09150 [Pseudonocardia nematodicida]|uniref:Uncharacterized protein n=1 Tax=Pseudonocardia nematodicida TaxID=1206997 RepID=A0ABV1K820_9PSEU
MTDTPAGAPLPGAPGAAGHREAVSVAELLARHSSSAQQAREAAGPATGQVLSVGDLLRREGRAPAVPTGPTVAVPTAAVSAGTPGGWPDIDLPQPRATGAGAAQEWPVRPASGRRRAGAVAGALVAAGSVFGAALYNGAASHDSEAQAAADGLFPGVGLPAADPAGALPAQYLPANVALSTPLPELPETAPGAGDWMGVAFGQQQGSGSAAGTLREVSTGAGPISDTGTGTTAPAPAPAQSVQNALAAVATAPAGGSTGTGSPLGELPVVAAINNPDRAPAGNLLDPVTAPGPSAGGTSTGPVQDVTESVRPVGDGVGGVVAPVAVATAPVGDLVGGTVSPVTGALSPVTAAAQPLTQPVADTLEPVTTPVLGALSPVTEPVLSATEPLTGPVLRAAEPVTSLLDTSSAQGASDDDEDSTGDDETRALPLVGQTVTDVAAPVTEATEGVTAPVTDVVADVTEPVGETVGDVTAPVESVTSSVTEPVGETLSDTTEPVADLASGVTEPVGGLVGGVVDAPGSLFQSNN